MHNSVAVSRFTLVHSYHLHRSLKSPSLSKQKLCPHWTMTSSSLWEIWLLSLCASHYYRFLTSVGWRNTAFSPWLVSLSRVSFYSCLAFSCVIQHSLSVCLATDRHLSCSAFQLLEAKLLWTQVHEYLSPSLLSVWGYVLTLCLVFGGFPVLSSLSFRQYVPTNFGPLRQSLHTSPTLVISDAG